MEMIHGMTKHITVPRIGEHFSFGRIRISKRKVFVELGFTLITAAALGLAVVFAAQAHGASLSHGVPLNNVSSSITPSKPSSSTSNLGVAQSNTLFAEYPSWIQDYATDSSNSLSSNDWNIYQGPAPSNNEAEYYTNNSANLRIQNGALTLEAIQQSEPQGYSYSSARVDTMDKKTFLYGRIDITAKLPDGIGTWPAAWLLPATTKYEDLSPASDTNRYLNGGEMDLIEQVGIQKDVEYGIVHSESDLNNPADVGDYSTVSVNNNVYNKYSLLWTPTSVTFEVNDVPFYTYVKPSGANYQSWPFDQPFYLILNLALGGSWGGQDKAQFPSNGIDNATLPASMDIQSIYYYPYVGSPSS